MANGPELKIEQPIIVAERDTLLRIQDLRRRAWSANGEIPDFIARQDILNDEHDVHGMHWTILQGDRPIAAARLCVHENVALSPDPEAYEGYEGQILGPVASMTRLVVDPDFRRRNLSKAMDNIRLDKAKELQCRSVVSVGEIEFRMRWLERLGFVRLGPTRIRYLSYAPSIVLLKSLARSLDHRASRLK
jgi:GNAT superfamily N-acetyltransferase